MGLKSTGFEPKTEVRDGKRPILSWKKMGLGFEKMKMLIFGFKCLHLRGKSWILALEMQGLGLKRLVLG